MPYVLFPSLLLEKPIFKCYKFFGSWLKLSLKYFKLSVFSPN